MDGDRTCRVVSVWTQLTSLFSFGMLNKAYEHDIDICWGPLANCLAAMRKECCWGHALPS